MRTCTFLSFYWILIILPQKVEPEKDTVLLRVNMAETTASDVFEHSQSRWCSSRTNSFVLKNYTASTSSSQVAIQVSEFPTLAR